MIPADLPPPPDLVAPAPRIPGPCLAVGMRGPRPASTGSVVSDLYPIRVHWGRPEDEAMASDVLGYLELSWRVQVEEIGFRPPVLPDGEDGPEFDLYLRFRDQWDAWATIQAEVDSSPGDGHMSAPAWIVLDSAITEPWLGSYVAHEFNHVLQYATDFTEYTLPVWEGVATAAQKWTLGDAGLWDEDDVVVSFQEAPWAPTFTGDSYTLWEDHGVGYYFEYGTAAWVLHLDERLGTGDGKLIAQLWEDLSNEGWTYEPDVVDALPVTAQMPLGELMSSVALARYLTGDRWDERGLVDAADWPAEADVFVSDVLALTDLPAEASLEPRPMILGQALVEVDAVGDGTLVVDVASERGLSSAVAVLWWAHGESGVAWSEEPRLEVAQPAWEAAVVVLSNLGPDGWDGDADPYRPGDQVLRVSWVPTPSGDIDDPGGGCGCAAWAPGSLAVGLFALPLVCLRRRRLR